MNGNSVVVRHPSTEMIRDAFMSISLMRKGRLNSRSFCLYCNNSFVSFSSEIPIIEGCFIQNNVYICILIPIVL